MNNILILARTTIDGLTIIQTTMVVTNSNIMFYTEVYCMAYGKQFITVAVATISESAKTNHNYWVGTMAADIQPPVLVDVIDKIIYPKK